MLISKRMKVTTCVETRTLWVNPQDTTTQKKGMKPKDRVNAAQIYEACESKEQIFGRYQQVKHKDTDKAAKHRTETMQSSEVYDKWKPEFINMKQKHESVRSGHLEKLTVAKHKSFLKPPDAQPTYSALYPAGTKQKKLGREKVAQIKKAGVVQPTLESIGLAHRVFALKERKPSIFCRLLPTEFQVQSVIVIQYHVWMDVSILFEKQSCFLSWIPAQDTSRLK